MWKGTATIIASRIINHSRRSPPWIVLRSSVSSSSCNFSSSDGGGGGAESDSKDFKLNTNFKNNYWNKEAFGKAKRFKKAWKPKLTPTKQAVSYYKDVLDSASAYWTKEVAEKEEVMKTLAKVRKYRDTESLIAEGNGPEALINAIALATLESESRQQDYDTLANMAGSDVPAQSSSAKREPTLHQFESLKAQVSQRPKVLGDAPEKKRPLATKTKTSVKTPEPSAGISVHVLGNSDRPIFQAVKERNLVTYETPRRYNRLFQRDHPCHYPSISRILRDTMSTDSRMALQIWEERLVKELGREGFQAFQRKMLQRGQRLHTVIEKYLISGGGDLDPVLTEHVDDDLSADEVSLNHLRSVRPILDRFSRPFALESHVAHPELEYQGYLDCVALYKNSHLVLIDWKTSERKKKDLKATFDNPLQVAAYSGALNHDSKYDVQILRGMIVLVYNDGSEADVLHVEEGQLRIYWQLWLKRLEMFKKMAQDR